MIKVTCLGATGTVTGSSFLVESAQGKKILVDCGLFQGGKEMELRNGQAWGFDPKTLQALLLTHAHIDHSGRIPKLVKDGFKGPIVTSPPTAELCRIMLLDSAHVQEMDAEWQTRKNKRRAEKPVQPLYTVTDAEAALKQLQPLALDQMTEPAPGIKARLRNAGHILGSASLELWFEEKNQEPIKIVFSGDLGNKDQLIVQDPQPIFDADYLFMESTYGDRLHRSLEDSKQELLEAITYSYGRGEKVVIPAFAVERTQELLLILSQFQHQGLLPDLPIYLDSPLAIKATRIFRKNIPYFDEETRAMADQGRDPFDLPNLHFTESTQDSIAINEKQGPAIVIAGNGMCTAGRIKHHLKHNLWRPGSSLVIVGFQGNGTLGRMLVDGAKQVKLFNETVAVHAKIFTINGFSAHADQNGLLEWVGHFESKPRIFLVHGEPKSSEGLRQKIRERFDLDAYIPRWQERLILKPREMSSELPVATEPEKEVQQAVLSALSTLEKDLQQLNLHIHTGISPGADDLDKLQYIHKEFQFLLAEHRNRP
jgi:metallo-beta-lactamase family protein